jgi:hypothetical protein
MIDTYLYRYWTYVVGKILSDAAQYHQVFGHVPTPISTQISSSPTQDLSEMCHKAPEALSCVLLSSSSIFTSNRGIQEGSEV